MYQDDLTKKLAEAAKAVIEGKKVKETEVQPSDKDFVDLHSIDKEKRRGSTPLTEKDVEEANEFTKAAAKAAVAGDDEFEFDGKKFPTEMDVDVAKKILGESVESDESSKLTESNTDKYMWSDINNALKAAGLDIRTILSVVSKLKGKEIKEEIDLTEAFIDVDASDPKSIEFAKLIKKYRVKARIITMNGPGGGMPLVRLTGKKKDLVGILKDPMGWQDDGFLAGFIEESLNFDEESEIDEAIYQIVEEENVDLDGLTEEQLDELIGKALKKVGSKIKKVVKGRVTTAGRAERLTKKADKADKKQADRDKLKKAKARLKIQKAKRKKNADNRKAAKARLNRMKNENESSSDIGESNG